MNINTTKFQVHTAIGWGHMHWHKETNKLAEEICYKAKEEGKTCFDLIMDLFLNEIPVNIIRRLWTGEYEGEIFKNRVLKIEVGTEGTELWVFCDDVPQYNSCHNVDGCGWYSCSQ